MGWDCDIIVDKDISEKDVDTIVSTLPEDLNSQWGTSKQSWGWSCGTDIYKPKENKLGIHGAGFSEHLSEPMVDYLKRKLRELGYKND